MKHAKTTVVIVSGALICVVLGFFAGVYYQARSTQMALSLLSGRIMVAEADDLERIYKSETREQKMRALEHFARISEMTKAEASLLVGDEVATLDLAFTYARLGLLYQQSGDTQKAAQYFDKAVERFPAREGKKASADEIIKQVLLLDRASIK